MKLELGCSPWMDNAPLRGHGLLNRNPVPSVGDACLFLNQRIPKQYR